MRRIFWIALLCLIILNLLGYQKTNQDRQIAKVVGIGDSLSGFQSSLGYGENKGWAYSFLDGKILVMLVNDRAFNITIYPSSPSPKLATDELVNYLPTDYKIIKKYSTNEGTHKKIISLCSSEKLAKVFNEEAFGSSSPGSFVIIQKAYLSNNDVFVSILGLGHKP